MSETWKMDEEQLRDSLLPSHVNLMEVFPKILSVNKETFKITPSEFMKEMGLSTEERYKKLVRTSNNIKTGNLEYPSDLRIIPHVLIFQRFEPLSSNRLTIQVKNVGKSLLPIRMRCPQSVYFSANFIGPGVYRIASGLSVEFEVTFVPKERRDYHHCLMITSKEETFQIPIVAIGPRAMLDIPDQIILNPTPVKVSSNKFIVMRNIGSAPALFNFVPQGTHFQATPAKGALGVGHSILLNISFESSKVGEVTEDLFLVLETGEKLKITLHGSAENVSVRLDKNSVVQEDTFIGLKRGKTVRLFNNSSSTIKFSWRKNKTLKEDLDATERMKEKFEELYKLEKLKDSRVIYSGLSNAEKHNISCERILKDELRLLEKEEFKFSNEIFSIVPECGEVWPKGVAEMIVSFEPKVPGTVHAEAFLDVSGRDSRLPLKMKGTGLGPKIVLNVNKLDIDFIFLCSTHKYEISVKNIGDISGTLEYINKPMVFGGKAIVSPLSRHLKAGEVTVFFVAFTSNRLGDFTEHLYFLIKESGEKISFVLKGKIISPSLHFDTRMIDFGVVPFGIPVKREVNLQNLSIVPVKFSLRVTPDGDFPSISIDKFTSFYIKPNVPRNPREFHVYPEESVVEPFSSKKVTVTLTSNKEGKFDKKLVVDLWDAENGSESCPIKYTTQTATLVVSPKTIIMPSCFINYPYTTTIVVKNEKVVPGFFYIPPQETNENTAITFSASISQGLLGPGSSVEIDITVILNALGKQYLQLYMLTFGHPALEPMCLLNCMSQGPVLTTTPSALNWGEVNLLEVVTKEIEFLNDSPVPAQLTLNVEKGKNNWNVKPLFFTLLAGKTEKIFVDVLLKDCGNYRGSLKVDIYNGKAVQIPLSATGVGCSLVMTPKLNPTYFVGTLFCNRTYKFDITVENVGSKMYSVMWSPFIDCKDVNKIAAMMEQCKIFKINPIHMEIYPLEKVSAVLYVHSESPGTFKQTYYCYGNVGTYSAKEHLLTSEISAEFLEPTITCDKNELHFFISNSPGVGGCDTEVKKKVSDTINFHNTSLLPIEIVVSITKPFFLVDDLDNNILGFEYSLTGLETKEMKVLFLPETNKTKYSKSYPGKLTVMLKHYSKSVKKINIPLFGEVSYPNISINPRTVDFGYVEVGTNSCREIKIVNRSPLTVYYVIKWDAEKSSVAPIERAASTESFLQCSEHSYLAKEEVGETESHLEVNQNHGDELLKTDSRTSNTLVIPKKPILKMPEVDISNDDIKTALFPIARNYYNCDDHLLEAYKLVQSLDTENTKPELNFTKFCDITPFYGVLEPSCSDCLSVTFYSDYPVQVYAKAVIQVNSGPDEIIMISATSSKVNFQLSTTEMDFGKQLFCETKSQGLLIKNLGAMPFSFEAEIENDCTCEGEAEYPLGRGMMTISPNSGTVDSFKSVELIVRYHPGVPGLFESKFQLQIACFDPISIAVKGMGVFPQVYITLPRPEILGMKPEIGYTATASLTPDWIVSSSILESFFHNTLKPYRSRESNVGGIMEVDPNEDQWEFITHDAECMPSEMDIYLAIERFLAYQLIPMDTEKAIFAVYARTIPRFSVPAYVLDFGVCVSGIRVERNVKIMNFGPLPAIIYGIFTPNLKEKGIFFRVKIRNELKVCSCLSFAVTFYPKKSNYKNKYEKVEHVFHFEIYHGPKIPIRILAEVTQPHVISSRSFIDFGEVVCGSCRVVSLRLKNPGLVPAQWWVTTKKNDPIKDISQDIDLKLENTMFYLDCSKGTLNPEEYCTVQVFFRPEYGGTFSTSLYIHVTKGTQKTKILLSGVSVEPKLTVSTDILDFKSTLPFPRKAEKIFTVANICDFPIEFYFEEFDEQILEEERILRAVILYYETNEILLPIRKAGETLPQELIDFYYLLRDALNAKYMEEEREKILAEKQMFEESNMSLQEEDALGSNQSLIFDKKKKKGKKFSRSKTTMGSSRGSLAANSGTREPDVPTIFEQKSPVEIQDMLEEFIRNRFNKDFIYDPVQAAIKHMVPPEKEEEYRDGTLIICHGAPYTNSILLANRLGLFTKMPVLSIDHIVLSEAALGRCEAGLVVKDLIEQAYSEYIQMDSHEITLYNAWEENEFLISEDKTCSFSDDFDDIHRKFKALIQLREKLVAEKGKSGLPSSSKNETPRKPDKASSSGKLQMNLSDPIANITEALVVDILRYRLTLEVEEGLIIEGLQSQIIGNSTPNALISVLKAAGNIKDIIVIIFLNNYEHYQLNLSNSGTEQELLKNCIQDEALKILEEEPEEVFENLNFSNEDAQFLREEFLRRRRQSFREFLLKKDAFYKIGRVKTEPTNRGISVLLNTNYELHSEGDSRKKKDAEKSKKNSAATSRISGSEVKSGKFQKQDAIEDEFLTFELDLAEVKAVISNWDQRLGALVIDSISEVMTKKGQTPRKSEDATLDMAKNRRGIFTWLVDLTKTNGNSFFACCCQLKKTLQERWKPSESHNWPLTSSEYLTFSIVSLPPKRTKRTTQKVFTITAMDSTTMMGEDSFEEMTEYPATPPALNPKLSRSLSAASLKSKTLDSRASKRRKTESRSHDVTQKLRKSSLQLTWENQLKPRRVLPPGVMQTYKVHYYPEEMGSWSHHYVINLVNWGAKNVVQCQGFCDIPSISPLPEKRVLHPVTKKASSNNFDREQFCGHYLLDFGQIILSQSNGKKNSREQAVVTLINKSTLPVDLAMVFGEEGSNTDFMISQNFTVEPNTLWINPGGRNEVTITAAPSKVGVVSECLLLVVKDNPKVEVINLMFEAVKASVTVTPKEVNYEKLLLRRKSVRQVMITNENSISLYFVLKGLENLPQCSFSQVNGMLPPKESLQLEITYNAKQVEVINDQEVQIQVFDSAGSEEVAQELSFGITAEAYDVALDIIFSNPDISEIHFGNIRVERQYRVDFNLRNVGKYPLSFTIEILTKFLKGSELYTLYCSPQEGKLLPGKLFPVTANLRTDGEISWKHEPLIKIYITEPSPVDDLIAVIPLEVTARSYFSRYEISPSEELNFGHVNVGTTTSNTVVIENKGQFSFTYYMEVSSSGDLFEEKGSSMTRKSSSKEKEKERGKKVSLTTMKAGIFEVSPSTGVVEVGQKMIITISCHSNEVKNCKEKIIIFVNESPPHLKRGNPLTISADVCLPMIAFEDYKNMFREHVVRNDESELHCMPKTGPQTIYTINNNLFSFKNVCVGKTEKALIYLRNSGWVDCSVNVSIVPEREEEKGAQGDTEYFSLDPKKLLIEPYNSGTISLTFKPNALELYRAKLKVTLEMPPGYENVVHIFGLTGTGILPQIEITEPNTRLPEGQTLVNFPPTSPGRQSTASIAFTNTGVLDCKVIVELYKPVQPSVFTLFPKPSTEKMLKIWELAKLIDHTVIVTLSPGDVAEFNVMFNPTELRNYSSQIKLFIVDNPFENWCFKLTGEVFFEEIVIEKIRTSLPFPGKEDEKDCKLSLPLSPGQYFVSFGDCFVKNVSKVLMRLSNKTEKEYFKFEWDEVQNISVSPAIGHLYPNSYKEILLTFQPEEPVDLDDTTLSCKLNRIHIENPPQPSWDSRLMLYLDKSRDLSVRSTDRNSSNPVVDRSIISGKEPEHEVVPESQKLLFVNLSGIADYARLTCETTKIHFKDTFMFQTRIFPLVLENSGNIALEYKLILNPVTLWPLMDNKKCQVDEQALKHNSRPQSSSRCDIFRRPHVNTSADKKPRPFTSLLDFREITSDEEDSTVETTVMEESSYFNPFTIENSIGRILPREKAYCNIKFSPLDVNEFKTEIIITVLNLHPECKLPEIQVIASSLMPYCHFDVPESDYLESGRREHSRPGPIGFSPGVPLPPDTKTIEIKVLGIGVTTPIKFHGINPTKEDYTFSWVNITQSQPDVIPSFYCSTVDGRIGAGRQQLMIFNFVSQKPGITESFWKFSIPKYEVETTFLFVGDVREPAVCFLTNHLTMKPTLIGCTSSDEITMINHENKAFEFNFVPNSLYSEGCLEALEVKPRSGKILPNSEKRIGVTFTGKTPGKSLFNLKCKVKRVKEPFIIPVEVSTYAVHPMITMVDFEGMKYQVELNKENLIDFGSELTLHTPKSITITLMSLSRTSYYFDWEYDENLLEGRHCSLQFSPQHGHVASFSREKCDLKFMFTKNSSLTKFPVSLKIRRGPTFRFLVSGRASSVLCEFSFNSYDFGYCFLQQKDVCFNETSLFLINRNTTTIFLECTLPESTGFSYVLPQSFIRPSEELPILIRFHPKECIPYEGVLKITINGYQERSVLLKGHGAEFKVQLADVEDTTISLDAVKVGKTSTRKFCLVNKSLTTATVLVGFADQLPVNGEYLARPQDNTLDLSQNHRLTNVITIKPSTAFKIKPQETFTLKVTFSPEQRLPPFSETVCLQYQERAEPLCLLTGCAIGAEISLDRNILNFGAVVEGCRSDLKLKLINSGSIGARFEWNVKSLTEYSISPAQGYCSAESDVTITVTFFPFTVQNHIKNSVECQLYLSESESYPSQWLSLIGDCIATPEPKEVVQFQCLVREKDTKEVIVNNTSGNEWQLIPILSGEYFKGLDVLIVPPLSSATFTVDYCPLTMTTETKFHEGSAFFKLPNGQALLYLFNGVSLPPNPQEIIEREVPCKTKYVELLKIKNWLPHPQRFRTHIIPVDNVVDPTCTCTGFEYLEVPALVQREYTLNFFSYNVGEKKFEVKFINEESGEYIWYNIGFKVTMCGPLEVITLKCGVRQTCQHEIKLENPLNTPIVYALEAGNPEIHFESNSYEVPPEQSVYVKISFTPIHPGENVVLLNASCPELGVFPRELRLTAIQEVPSTPRVFETHLGTSQTQEFVIKNISTLNAVLHCKVDSDDFFVLEKGVVEARQSTTVKVTYEPTEIGSTTANLFVTSEQAGQFVFPLLGMSIKPIAKGPFIMQSGQTITIPFKNVFNKTKEFHMYVDNQGFVLKSTQEILSAKEECKIAVTFQKLNQLEKLSEYQDTEIQTAFPVMGQLIVECISPYVKWQFYLKGVFEK